MKRNKAESSNQKRLRPRMIRHIDFRWVFIITIISFFISIIFSAISSAALVGVDNITAFIILFSFIFVGIIFDIIGVASTTCDEKQYHSMASKKVRAAKKAVWLTRNAEKVSSFCNDVVGDISGIISGATGAIIISRIAIDNSPKSIAIGLFITGIIAGFTIGGKAIGKSIGINYSNEIIYTVAKIISAFNKK